MKAVGGTIPYPQEYKCPVCRYRCTTQLYSTQSKPPQCRCGETMQEVKF